MASLTDSLKQLEEKLEDLQRDTKFCVNNYDYHHENNEHEILQKLRDILKDSYQDGKRFLKNLDKLRSLINTANKKCAEVDEMLKDLGVDTEIVDFAISTTTSTAGNCSSSRHACTDLEDNKENENY